MEELNWRVAFFFCLITCKNLISLAVRWWRHRQTWVCPIASRCVTVDFQQGPYRVCSLSLPRSVWVPLTTHSVSFEVKWNVCCVDSMSSLAEDPQALGYWAAAQAMVTKCISDCEGLRRVFVCKFLRCKQVLISLNLLAWIFSHWFFRNPSLFRIYFSCLHSNVENTPCDYGM